MSEAKHEESPLIQPEWRRAPFGGICDAVITADTAERITSLNPLAASLTGWAQADAVGQPLESVFKIVDRQTRMAVESPTVRSLREDVVVGLANHTLLIAKDGLERPIEDSAAPIHNERNELAGVVLVFRDITERRKTELALDKALAYADDIIATLREPFVVLDQDLRVKTANGAFYKSFHVTKQETESCLLYELGNGAWDIPRLRTLLVEALSLNHSVQDFEVEHAFPVLGRKTMLLNARRFPPDSKNPELILLAIEDITERKQGEDKLRESEQRQRLVLDSIPQKIATTKPNGAVDYFNPQWTEFTGLSFEQIKEWGWKQIIHPDDLAAHVQTWQHSILSGEPFDFKSRFRRADGVYRWHVSRAGPIRDEAGRVVLWVGSNTDIHDIKQVEKALLGSEVRYRRLFETAKDGILILDTLSGRITDANPFMSELLGYSHAHFSGKELWEIGLFSDKVANEAAVRKVQETGYIRYEHLPLETNDGRRVEVEIVANAYLEDHHKVIQCNIRDITERSRLEKQLQEQATALADLHRRKDEFLAMLSHELRNPLAPITNAVQLLSLQKNEGKLQQQARAIIERQVGQLTRLIDDLLEVSRISTGRIHLQLGRVALNGIVEHGVEAVRALVGQRRHELSVKLPSQPIWLHADASRLEQVVVNLLNNAAKYTADGGHISLAVEQEGDEAVMRVRDTGVGIAPELLPRIFDLFTQAERSLDRSQGGLGIGLSLVQRLVEMHGGSVQVYSALGQGSEFVVRLPAIVTPAIQPPSTESVVALPTASSLRVLVVDDNVDAAQTLEMLLQSSGHESRVVHDGLAALEIALEYRPDVVLLDIGLPGLDGFEIAKRLRRQPTLDGIVLVAMTGYGHESDHQRSRDAGFDHHLVKPTVFGKV